MWTTTGRQVTQKAKVNSSRQGTPASPLVNTRPSRTIASLHQRITEVHHLVAQPVMALEALGTISPILKVIATTQILVTIQELARGPVKVQRDLARKTRPHTVK